MTNCCSHGTFRHFSLQSSHLNICYFHQDLHQRPFHAGSRPDASQWTSTPSYSLARRICTKGQVSVLSLSAIHFQGRFIRQVSCYTLLSGFRLPWPPSCCLNESTPFVVSDELEFRHLNLTFGSSRIASSAYQKWPTKNSLFEGIVQKIKQLPHQTYLKFENRLKLFQL